VTAKLTANLGNIRLWIRIHSESRSEFTGKIEYNSDIIWHHCCLLILFSIFCIYLITHNQDAVCCKWNGIQAGFTESKSRFWFTTYPNPDSLIKYPLIYHSWSQPLTLQRLQFFSERNVAEHHRRDGWLCCHYSVMKMPSSELRQSHSASHNKQECTKHTLKTINISHGWHSGSIIRRMNQVTLLWTWIVPGWVSVFWWIYHLGF